MKPYTPLMQGRSRQLRRQQGFTLIEILVVVVIIAVLAAVVVPNVIGRIKGAKVSAAMANIKAFDNAIDQYHLDTGQIPAGLDALTTNPGTNKWNGPYFKGQSTIPPDPWGHPYIYKAPGDNGRDYEISSSGPDEQAGTGDDIKSWDIGGNGDK